MITKKKKIRLVNKSLDSARKNLNNAGNDAEKARIRELIRMLEEQRAALESE